jgi:hypothetical protein
MLPLPAEENALAEVKVIVLAPAATAPLSVVLAISLDGTSRP